MTAYRCPGGAGVRLDGGTNVGAEVLAHFDSMLVKLTCRGRDFAGFVAHHHDYASHRRRPDLCGDVLDHRRPRQGQQ